MLMSILYLVCFILTYGAMFAMVQRGNPVAAKYDYKPDMICSIFLGFFGPIIVPIILIISAVSKKWLFKYGLKFW
jgi:hypothetical protein